MPIEPALAASEGRMPRASWHGAIEGQAGTDPRSGLVAQGASGEMAWASPRACGRVAQEIGRAHV
jgi:hypothetical protein